MRQKHSVVVADGRGSRKYSLRLVAVVLTFVVAIVIVWPTVARYYSSQRELAAARAELTTTEEHIEELQTELDLWNDDDFVRSQARERLGYVMPGQTLYVVKDPGAGTAQDQRDERIAEVNRNRRAATPWYVTMWDSVSVAGQTEAEFDNPNDVPVLNSPEPTADEDTEN
ncbi:FtsB family cell division protein [Ancrocorticia populi]